MAVKIMTADTAVTVVRVATDGEEGTLNDLRLALEADGKQVDFETHVLVDCENGGVVDGSNDWEYPVYNGDWFVVVPKDQIPVFLDEAAVSDGNASEGSDEQKG